ncbi:hypothetical protein N657DRAFT_635945 [Parathielavia appendiculata]|uniref:Uncharacterized protein n=1 Tax=Parathielavia appendiculata TaxID=2587402 RepID=A0AAN6Z298_9PEZI|nr:hypothetical protein N657DRAFT_635945 [Parathielavia appendiculata]
MPCSLQCFEYLDGVLDVICAFGDDVCVHDDDHLATLNVRKAEPLDTEEQSIDFGRRFFDPGFTVDQARQKPTNFLVEHGEPGTRSPNLGVWEGSEWCHTDEVNLVPEYMGNLQHHEPGLWVGTPPRLYWFHVSKAFLIQDLAVDKPHIGRAVVDSTEPNEEDVLRNPVITQIHFDGRSLVLRQSRLLNFRGNEPTADAYHMIRWMTNHPMGEIRFRKVADQEPEQTSVPDVDKSNGNLPVDMRGA